MSPRSAPDNAHQRSPGSTATSHPTTPPCSRPVHQWAIPAQGGMRPPTTILVILRHMFSGHHATLYSPPEQHRSVAGNRLVNSVWNEYSYLCNNAAPYRNVLNAPFTVASSPRLWSNGAGSTPAASALALTAAPVIGAKQARI
jgi:hypothetical protein